MKNILLLALILYTAVLNGQTFDFYSKKIVDEANGVIKNQNSTIKIININLFKYSVLVSSKTVNNNTDMPDIFEQYIKFPESKDKTDTGKKDFAEAKQQEEKKGNFDEIYGYYIKLKSSEQFYSSLVDLVGSNLLSDDIIAYKKKYYKHFMTTGAEGDDFDVPEILKHYSILISNISYYAPIFKPSATEEEKALIDSILNNTRKISTSKVPEKLASLYGAINSQNFTIDTFIPKPNSDELMITISAKPNPVYNKCKNEIKIEIPFAVKGGFKIDFSTGIFISNIVNKDFVSRPIYSTVPIAGVADDSIDGYMLVKADSKPISYGIVGYMHAYWRNVCNINCGISFGLSVDQNTQVKIMPGLSLILGRKERFIINGGLAIGKCKELSPVQNINHLYKTKVEPIYSEPYKFGWFIGLSYNVSK